MLSPGESVTRYLPNRSTMPARACGMIRTVLASRMTTKMTKTARMIKPVMVPPLPLLCGARSGAADVGRRAPDLDHLGAFTGLDLVELVVRGGGPLVAADLDPTGLSRREDRQHLDRVADQCRRPGLQLGTGVERLDQARPQERDQPDRGAHREHQRDRAGQAEQGREHPDEAADRQHDEDQVEADQFHHGETDRGDQPGLPQVVADPVHVPRLPGSRSGEPAHSRWRRDARRAVKRPSAWPSTSGIANVSERISAVITSATGPWATTAPRRSSIAWVKPGGICSTWCDTRTVAGELASCASVDSVETRSSRPPRSSPAAGSSRISSSGSVISARAIWTRLRSPSLRVPNVRSTRWPAPTSTSRATARSWSSSS